LGGKIPRNIKVKVIRDWLDGLTRERIVKKEDVGAGSVTGIIQEARKEEEYNDIDLLREVAVRSKEEGIGLPLLAFATKLKRIMEENDINEDQIEPIIQDFAAYCLRHNVSYDTVIQSGREALYLEEKFGIPVERIPEHIIQEKETIDRLEEQRLEILRQKQQARKELDKILQERDTIVAELDKYGKEIPSIKCINQLETELDETKRSEKSYKTYCKRLAQDVSMLDTQNIEYLDALSQTYKELDKLKEVNERLAAENKDLKLDIYNLKTVDKQLAKKDSQIDGENKMGNPY
jgi:cell division protein FtsB